MSEIYSKMEREYQDVIDNLEKKLEELLKEFEQTQSENKSLHRQLEDTKKELLDMQLSYKEMKTNYERLQLAKAFGMSENSKKKAHLRLTRLVRDIDTCIALINNNGH